MKVEGTEVREFETSPAFLYPRHKSRVTSGSEGQPDSSREMTGWPYGLRQRVRGHQPRPAIPEAGSVSVMLAVVAWQKKTRALLFARRYF